MSFSKLVLAKSWWHGSVGGAEFQWKQDFDEEDSPNWDLEVRIPVEGDFFAESDVKVDIKAYSVCVEVKGKVILDSKFSGGRAVNLDPTNTTFEFAYSLEDEEEESGPYIGQQCITLLLEPTAANHWTKLFAPGTES